MHYPSKVRLLRTGAAALMAGVLTVPLMTMPAQAVSAPSNHSSDQSTSDDWLSVSEDFEADDGSLSDSWVQDRGTWAIDDGAGVNTEAGAQNNVATFRELELGAEYRVSADIEIVPNGDGDGFEWSGIAANVTGEGSDLRYHLLRVSTASADGEQPARWQLLRMTGTSPELLEGGELDAPVGTALTLSLARTESAFEVLITDSDSDDVLVDKSASPGLPEPGRTGGYAGLYAVTGNLRALDFDVESSPTPAPDPFGELECSPEGDSYDFPSEEAEVLESMELDQAWSGMFVVMDLVTRDDQQYVGYWNDDRQMVVAHRTLGASEDEHSDWAHEILDEDLGWDSHNYISLGIDRDGNLHASGNMHNDPMVYFRTSEPGDVTTLERQDSVVDPSTEQSVTYPEFVNRQDGSLVFSHRDGGSGDGVSYFNVFDEFTDQWSRLIDEPLFDGETEDNTYNSYFEGPVLGPDGYFHLLWVWRETPDAATNSMISYAKSEDLVDWTDSEGNPLTAPFQYGEGDIVDPIPQRGGLLNGNAKIGFDANDDVVVSYHKYDEYGGSQLYAARSEGSGAEDAWVTHQLTDWDGRWDFGGGGTLIFEIDMLGSEVLEDGNIQVNFECFGEENSIVVDGDLQPLAHVHTPALPGGLGDIQGDWQGSPGLQANVREDRGSTSLNGEYILRWESLPENRDMAYDEYPQSSPLEVIRIGQASEDPGDPEHEPWDSTAAYTDGDTVAHEGRVFEALWWTQNQEPGASPWSGWSEVGEPTECESGSYPAWAPSSEFEGGETVVHEGTVYTAQWHSRNQAPGDQWGPWEEQGTC